MKRALGVVRPVTSCPAAWSGSAWRTMVVRMRTTAPGPRGTKALLTYAGLFADPIKAYRRVAAHGDIASMRLDRSRRFYMLSNPEHVEHVLAGNQDNYVK